MAFQTFENGENNRGKIKRKNLKNEIRSTWLALQDLIRNPERHTNLFEQFNADLAKSIINSSSLVQQPTGH